MKNLIRQRPILGWALYDFANSAFATTVIAGFFPLFYSQQLAQGLDDATAQLWFNWALAGSGIIVALCAPLLGALADSGNQHKRLLAAFTALGIGMSAALGFVSSGQWALGLICYGLGSIGFFGANIFYDALLVRVAAPRDWEVVSGFGYALGYLGGGLLFLFNVLMVQFPGAFGLAGVEQAVSLSFISVALWWAVFSLPLFRMVPGGDKKTGSFSAALADLAHTARQLPKLPGVLGFLLAYWLYIDGVNTVFRTAVFFASRVLELPASSLITALLLTQFIAFPAALGFGWLGKRIGARPGILLGLLVYALAVAYAWRWLYDSAGFYGLAAAIGLVQGGVQSLSRALYARLIPSLQSGQFFGLYNLIGKFATLLGPLLMNLVLFLPGATPRDSILALLLLFGVGAVLLWRVDLKRGMAHATEMDDRGAA